jgi:hypothetical protein
MKRILLVLGGLLALIGASGFIFFNLVLPRSRPPSSDRVEATPQRLERGRYLAETVVDCFGCHSDFDKEVYGGGKKEGSKGQGGLCFDKGVGFPGKICAQNITQDRETGLGEWTDGEIIRAFREGISRDGHALFPMMPYKYFRTLSDEDVKSIVVYLRTIPPIKRQNPRGHIDFPVSLFAKLEPQPVESPIPEPDRGNTVAYGKYLANLACYECHTPVNDKMQPIDAKAYSGGRVFSFMGLTVVSANITPDATGLGDRTRENFIGMFTAFRDPEFSEMKVPWELNTFMPWEEYAHMSEDDLGAIYDYLRTVQPVVNEVARRPNPTEVAQR